MRHSFARLFVAFCLLVSSVLAASAAPRFDFYSRGPYRTAVPRPSAVLGYEPGTFHTSFGNMERYVDALVHAASDRVRREPYGRTYEFRERALLIISSPENLARIDAIREGTAKLADPRKLASPAEAERLIKSLPVTVWLNYSIHGDESASFEAMAQVAYQLAAGEDSTTKSILDHCVVLINLAHNPDGHERFVTWINALGSGNPEPWALEQQRQQPWGIGGRTNHYQFDMNRDALAMSQVESRQIAQAFRRWRPQVFVDHHGQVASYFFPPTAPARNAELPGETLHWEEVFGRANAAAFDRYGWSYFVRDEFDFFYPGYWDIWPTFQGATGMTYETDGGGNLAIRRDDETVVTLLDGIERHFIASLATCSAAAVNREARLRDFWRFADDAIDSGRHGTARAYAFEPGNDPTRAAALAENLLNAGVDVQWVANSFHVASARPVWEDAPAPAPKSEGKGGKTGAPGRDSARGGMTRFPEAAVAAHDFAHGAFVVDLAQPAARLARTLIERQSSTDSAFERAELEKYQRNLKRGKSVPNEGYDFYDVTAWSLPISYGIKTWSLREPAPAGVTLAPPDPNTPDPADEVMPDSAAIGVPLTARVSRGAPLVLRDAAGRPVLDLHGRVEGGRAATAYVWAYDNEGAARLALRLLQEDFRVASSTRPLSAAGREFPRGSFIARVERNPATLHERVAALAASSGVVVTALQSAWSERGDTGVGSGAVASLKRPRIAVLADEPVSNTAFGWVWFLLERRLGIRFTAVRASELSRIELERYNVVVVPDGGGGGLADALGDGGISKLKGWIARGGTLVCLDDASEFPTLKSVGLSSAKVVGVKVKEKEKDKDDEKSAEPDTVSEDDRRPQYLPGTVFWATPDPRHFLCYGLDGARMPVLLQGRTFLKPSRDGANAIVFERAPLALSGWLWPETERRLSKCAYAVDEPNGGGHVIMIDGAPTFRLFWRSTERLLENAILFGPALN